MFSYTKALPLALLISLPAIAMENEAAKPTSAQLATTTWITNNLNNGAEGLNNLKQRISDKNDRITGLTKDLDALSLDTAAKRNMLKQLPTEEKNKQSEYMKNLATQTALLKKDYFSTIEIETQQKIKSNEEEIKKVDAEIASLVQFKKEYLEDIKKFKQEEETAKANYVKKIQTQNETAKKEQFSEIEKGVKAKETEINAEITNLQEKIQELQKNKETIQQEVAELKQLQPGWWNWLLTKNS